MSSVDAASTAVNATYAMWRKLSGSTLGRGLFSTAMCLKVPYFRTVLPAVRDMRPGRCEVAAPKWWGVHNHLGTFHAIAACNLAEIAMGMLAEATVPTTHRWIPKGMSVSYVAKAKTSLTAVAELPELPELAESGTEVVVPVVVRDREGTVVVTADITVWITPRS
ncbi:hotdog fold domain-containing protein [Prauserella rugosa]|nr:hotdog fold domain-containing protein [Prauserella rugosa]KMS90351.1 thioesterase [Streptomyces regensis]